MIRVGIRRVLHLALRRRDRWEREVEDEIKLHLALRAEQLVAQGRTADDAYAEAVKRFGPLRESRALLLGAAQQREQRMQRTEFVSDLRQDLAFALRSLRREKGWGAVTVATLALGIGATTAVFSVVSTLLLHPLPYPNSDRVVYVLQQPAKGNTTGISVSISPSADAVVAWRRDSHTFEAVEPMAVGWRALRTTSGEPSQVLVNAIVPSFMSFADRRPIMGRMFTDGDIAARNGVALLGEAFWKTRLASDPSVLGKTLVINDTAVTIIGVMPASLRGGTSRSHSPDVWVPLDLRDRSHGLSVIGRLRPGVGITSAEQELNTIFARAVGFAGGAPPFRTLIQRPAERVSFRDSLQMLTWAVGLVLLIACANVAHLLLARSATRQREMAIRAALGAGRGRLLRQRLAESVVISGIGAALGVALGWVGLHALLGVRPDSLGTLDAAHLDATTLGVAIAAAVVSAIVFTFIAGPGGHRSAHEALKQGARSASSTRRQQRVRGLIVITEMALSGMLLVAATLVVRSVNRLQHQDLGFQPDGLYFFPLDLPKGTFPSAQSRAAALSDFVSRVRGIPGVRDVAVASLEPGARQFFIGRFEVAGEDPPPKSTTSFTDVNRANPGYFRIMGMSLLEGRMFSDTTEASREMLINARFARKHWVGKSPLGQRLRIAQSESEPWLTVVGVVNDAMTNGPTSESSAPVIYAPESDPGEMPRVLVRTDRDASSLAAASDMLRQMKLARRATPPVSVADAIAATIAAPRFVMALLTLFTALALLLAAVGLYGVMAYTVTQRTREIGIRVALGASDEQIARAVIGQAAALAIIGAVVGLGAAAWGTQLIESQLHGVTRLDPFSFGIGAVVLIGAALVASIIPTRRALAVDPVAAIRAE